MILLKLFYNFLMVGLFSIGGGYTAISFASDIAREYEAIDEEMIENFLAIAESTPGPFAVNFATYVGTETAGIIGAIVATTALVLPAFFIILIFIIYFKDIIKNEKYKSGLSVIRSCVIGIIAAAGLSMFYKNIFSSVINIKAVVIAILLLFSMYMYKKLSKKQMSSILVIVCGAIFGIAINFLI